MKLTDIHTQKERIEALREIVKPFQMRAQFHELEGVFPFENYADLKAANYQALTIPVKYGGKGITLVDMLELQETIAKADGSTALAIGWHMGITKHLGENQIWTEEKYRSLAEDVICNGALLNNAASELNSGSPVRGSKPQTLAVKTDDGWIINGRKSYTTMAPVLDYFVVSASIDGTDDVGNFLVKRQREGVEIIETWDSVSMSGTGSHDLLLTNVKLAADDFVEMRGVGVRRPAGWLLHIPVCYLGIAKAACNEAVQFAATYSPGTMEGTIADIPSIQQKIGDMELLILESNYLLYGIAKKWDISNDEIRQTMQPELGAAKISVVNKAVEIVDIAMRIVGARSLSRQNPLQRYYRDVRAGLHNPPMDDMTLQQLGVKAVKKITKK